ncbi:BadF/BadG/BcrA/BcrD ATPase family protein [Leifsonia sp. fls2-241-R2A-40a]|uniref:BadF/BadG/BcrA/BcrD ATPase family protein n=1 Tax=Leifsonia sp. fls2-241-R2A-40a TaxID=3040290 RepID=UPI00254B5CCC|nr:BadF/BadG/BcrA/BcrD ATPase family protein [Leifsonia sp. fls2-241-R2A-40a]
MSRFLGVDGGGTKTAFALIDSESGVLARSQQASSDYYALGVEAVTRTFADGVDDICRQAGMAPDAIAFTVVGLPGYGEVSADQAALDAIPRPALGHDRFLCVNDMVPGWAGSLGAADGINVIGGTGSMTYGERDGAGLRVGGWGELFGDEGSGYWIADRGLNAFTRMSDGRLPRGPLYDLVKERTGIAHDLDLIGLVLTDWQKQRTRIAALSSTVAEAATAGDPVAADILAAAGVELAGLVEATRRQLGFQEDEQVAVSYSGGVFRADGVLQAFTGELGRLHAGYDLRAPLYEPDVGAALYAAKVSGAPLTADALGSLPRR